MVKLRGLNSKLSKLKLTQSQKRFLGVNNLTMNPKSPAHILGKFGRFVNKKVKRGWKNPNHFKY